jgi:hypothetical protein
MKFFLSAAAVILTSHALALASMLNCIMDAYAYLVRASPKLAFSVEKTRSELHTVIATNTASDPALYRLQESKHSTLLESIC